MQSQAFFLLAAERVAGLVLKVHTVLRNDSRVSNTSSQTSCFLILDSSSLAALVHFFLSDEAMALLNEVGSAVRWVYFTGLTA